MAGASFDIVFAGRMAEGADPALVQANVAKLFKTEPAKVAHLFSGQRVFIKKGVDEATARQYQAALGKAGALVEIVAVAEAGPAATAAALEAPAAPQPARSAARGGPAEPPPAARRAAPPVAPDYTVAEPGVVLVEAPPVPSVRIETAHLSLAEVGVDLAERRIATAPSYDLSGLCLAPPGTLLAEASIVPPAQIDTSALSLAE